MIRHPNLFAIAVTLGALLCGCGRDDYRMEVTPFPTTAPAPAPAPQPAAECAIIPTLNPAAESTIELLESSNTLRGVNLRAADLICIAYRTPEPGKSRLPLLSSVRVRATAPLPATRYDVRVHVPGGRAEQLRAALRDGLRRDLGIEAAAEWHETDVLALIAPGGRTALPPPPPEPPRTPGMDRLTLNGDDVSLLTEQLEEHLQRPVVNETGLNGSYRLYVDLPAGPRSDGGPAANLDQLRAALRQQLGLDLVGMRRRVEFLRVTSSASRR